MSDSYLAPGLPQPMPSPDGLDQRYWEGLNDEQIYLQRCTDCGGWQWGPEWICHRCLSFDLGFEAVTPTGRIYSFERVWHSVHPALNEQGPYIVVLVELPQADNVRLVGNLLGDPHQEVPFGAEVEAVFEHHTDADTPFTLLQWRFA
ncbi:MAG: OB-fold domain-containing protein [Gammaproteobacteria bacterium]|nr:OB-fold domain-containing protein [Gammaproteobacteria bacterium]